MTIGSLFSGYGGLDMAVAQVLGGEVAWVSDISPGACKIIAHRYPGVPNLGDITAVDWAAVEPVDVICGGSPCQDVSQAGRRAGMRPGTRSGLWESMREAIAVIRPTWVVWENVRGALSAEAHSEMEQQPGLLGDRPERPALRALGRVLGDLADLGYDAEWRGVRASDIGAPHQRFRIFVLARRRDTPPDTDYPGLEGRPALRRARQLDAGSGRLGPVTLLPTPTSNLGANGGPQDPAKRRAGGHSVSIDDAVHGLRHRQDWGEYTAAIRRWEHILGRPAPAPTIDGRLSPRLPEWMQGLPDGWVCDVPDLTRAEQLTALGNGVCPPQAVYALADMAAAYAVEVAAA